MAPEEVGNTDTSSSASKKKRDTAKIHWIITLKAEGWNGSNGSNLESWLKLNTSRAIWQVEQGEESGYKHVQLTLSLKRKNRISWLKHHFSRIAHCEVVNNIDAAFDYTSKTETRIDGPYFWPLPLDKGIIDPLEGVELYPWQKQIIDIISGPVDPRKIYWFWETKGNVGKSVFTKHLILNHKAVVYSGAAKDIVFAHKNQPVAIFHFTKTYEEFISYAAIESLKDGFAFSPKYESGMKLWNPPHIIAFANFEPDTTKMSQDRWEIKNLGV